jgi:predicted nucleic acid-binding protein
MKAKVYIETTIVSYLTAWPSRDIIVAAHQQITDEWWSTKRHDFELFASQLTMREAQAGDEEMAKKRLDALKEATLLETTEDALALAGKLINNGPLPEKAAEDAVHIAVAVVNGIDYLITWNCKHIANAKMRDEIELICRAGGYAPTIICTPEELLEDE